MTFKLKIMYISFYTYYINILKTRCDAHLWGHTGLDTEIGQEGLSLY